MLQNSGTRAAVRALEVGMCGEQNRERLCVCVCGWGVDMEATGGIPAESVHLSAVTVGCSMHGKCVSNYSIVTQMLNETSAQSLRAVHAGVSHLSEFMLAASRDSGCCD